jgi:hypothetical protein
MNSPTVLDVPQGPLLGPVLGRVVRFYCARAEMDIDQLSDAVLVTDALAARVWDHAIEGRVRIAVSATAGRVTLDIGPLAEGGPGRLLEATTMSSLGSILTTLADATSLSHRPEGDHLQIELART